MSGGIPRIPPVTLSITHISDAPFAHVESGVIQRWLGFSLQRFVSDKWIACRLIRSLCRCRGVG